MRIDWKKNKTRADFKTVKPMGSLYTLKSEKSVMASIYQGCKQTAVTSSTSLPLLCDHQYFTYQLSNCDTSVNSTEVQ